MLILLIIVNLNNVQTDKPILQLVGGTLAAIGASACCAGPLVLLLLGIGGSWVSGLTALEPYRPIFILIVVTLLIWAGWQIYRPVEMCSEGSVCALPQTRRRYRQYFWGVLLVAFILVGSPYWIPLIA